MRTFKEKFQWLGHLPSQNEMNRLLLEMVAAQTDLLQEMRDELRAIREATETEAVDDADPNPFQTLNGPSQ